MTGLGFLGRHWRQVTGGAGLRPAEEVAAQGREGAMP
jgi:hypothetical protein